jgi:FkbM family methyltransferase
MSFNTRSGWVVPEIDNQAFDVIMKQVSDVNKIIPHCTQRRLAIQAGGNIGIWAERLSRHFDTVVTIEPDLVNHDALVKNVGTRSNIKIVNAGLSNERGRGGIYKVDPMNIGAHQVVDGNEFDIITIDDLELENVDLIQLDIEGHEHRAILGAVKTIKRCNPVICLELKGLSKEYTDAQTVELMGSLGYTVGDKFNRDVLFINNKQGE